MKTRYHYKDKNGSVDDIFTPLILSFPGESVFLFLLGFKTWNIVRQILDDEW